MDNPEYTERQINEALSGRTHLPIRVFWDGNEPERDEAACFEVCIDGCETDLWVWDYGPSFELMQDFGQSRFGYINHARHFDSIAALIVETIEEDIASGKLGDYA